MEKNMSTDTNSWTKGVLLVIGAYIVTIGVAFFIVALTIILLLNIDLNLDCSDTSLVMLALWGIIAALFLASVVIVGVLSRKVTPSVAGRRAIVAVQGVALVPSFIVFAIGLMVAFNC